VRCLFIAAAILVSAMTVQLQVARSGGWPLIDPRQAFSMLREIEIAQARDLVFQGVRVNAVSHDTHRRAFGARWALPTQKCCPDPWRSGRGRGAIAAGPRVGLLRY
jgi:hypothetical protein